MSEHDPHEHISIARLTTLTTLSAICLYGAAVSPQTPEAEARFSSTPTPTVIVENQKIYLDQNGNKIDICAAVDTASRAESIGLLAQPDPGLNRDPFATNYSLYGSSYSEASEYFAKKYDLHIVDGVTPFEKYIQQVGTIEDRPYTEQLLLARNFMQKNFNVDVGLGYTDSLNPAYVTPVPTEDILNSPTAKQTMLNVLTAFDQMPTELMRLSGLQEIRFGHDIGGGAYAIYDENQKAIVVNLLKDYSISADSYRHEFMHLIDARLCGGPNQAWNDEEYKALNTMPGVYGDQPYTQSFENSGMQLLMSEIYNAGILEDTTTYCQLRAREALQGPRIQTSSNYHPTVVEDKAELAKYLLLPQEYDSVTNPNLPVIQAKFELLFARFYQTDPVLARYYASLHAFVTSMRSNAVDFEQLSC